MRPAERLRALRQQMTANRIDLYLVPSSDAHQNEYVPTCWQRRAWLTGFTGSAGDTLVAADRAFLWTDSRYHLQAEHQLDPSCFELMREGAPGVPTREDWLRDHGKGKRLGVDPLVISFAQARSLRRLLEAQGGELVALDQNLVDGIWPDAPALPQAEAEVLADEYAGRSAQEKLAQLRSALRERGCDQLLLTTLDAIAWTWNLRGRDIAFNPLLISYSMVGADDAVLFVDPRKLPPPVRDHLQRAGVRIEPYSSFGPALAALRGRVWLDPKTASWWVAQRLEQSGAEPLEARTPVDLAKARKNPTELAGMHAAHLRDGAALVRFLHWLEGAWGEGLDELAAAGRLERFRSEGERFQGLSFPTISGFAGNGAIVHYGVSEESAAKIDDSALYLVDSGAQYLDGTTDVTRTVHLGTPTPEERRHYTLVLKSHLALRHALFPKGTTGAQLDVLARGPLWKAGLNYGHGTGHGVGHYLNVHEGPQSISPRGAGVPLEPGMIVSNEPGLYLANRYGIRIENLVVVVEKLRAEETGGVPYYGFDDLTRVPYCRKLVDSSLLEHWEIEAINRYHGWVWTALEEELAAPSRRWLERETAPLAARSAQPDG